jgi:hypothetical protein
MLDFERLKRKRGDSPPRLFAGRSSAIFDGSADRSIVKDR